MPEITRNSKKILPYNRVVVFYLSTRDTNKKLDDKIYQAAKNLRLDLYRVESVNEEPTLFHTIGFKVRKFRVEISGVNYRNVEQMRSLGVDISDGGLRMIDPLSAVRDEGLYIDRLLEKASIRQDT